MAAISRKKIMAVVAELGKPARVERRTDADFEGCMDVVCLVWTGPEASDITRAYNLGEEVNLPPSKLYPYDSPRSITLVAGVFRVGRYRWRYLPPVSQDARKLEAKIKTWLEKLP